MDQFLAQQRAEEEEENRKEQFGSRSRSRSARSGLSTPDLTANEAKTPVTPNITYAEASRMIRTDPEGAAALLANSASQSSSVEAPNCFMHPPAADSRFSPFN